jgi:hypothetical protein
MVDGIDCNTDLALYADDTKIWRKIMSEEDNIKLQTDINYLLMWSINNKINFNFKKCKALGGPTSRNLTKSHLIRQNQGMHEIL